MGSVPGLGRSPGGRHGNPLQNSFLGNPMDRGAWQATVLWVTKSWIRLSDLACMCSLRDSKLKYFLFLPKERGQDLNLIWDKKEIQDESLQPSHEYTQFLLKSSPVIVSQVLRRGHQGELLGVLDSHSIVEVLNFRR